MQFSDGVAPDSALAAWPDSVFIFFVVSLVATPLFVFAWQRVVRESVLFVLIFACLFFSTLAVSPQGSRETLFLTGSAGIVAFLFLFFHSHLFSPVAMLF